MNYLLWPLISFLVLPTGWLEYKLLARTRSGILLCPINFCLLYGPWVMAIVICLQGCPLFQYRVPLAALGFCMVISGILLWIWAIPYIAAVPGQLETKPQELVTMGPYRWTRHPLYLGHVFFISGNVLIFAPSLFPETIILWIVAAIASKYEERTRLEPQFGEAFREYKAKTPLFLPNWGLYLYAFLFLLAIFLSGFRYKF